ncbi:MAG: DUF997 family protein [Verrucomicrobiota bacterium]
MSGGSELRESFRQSRREMWVILAAWAFFLLWTGIACTILPPQELSNGTIPTVLGIPQWVVFAVVLPWIGALIFICWFALRFMKDTDLSSIEPAQPDGGESDS